MPGEERADLGREGADGFTEPKVAQRSTKVTVAEAALKKKTNTKQKGEQEKEMSQTLVRQCVYIVVSATPEKVVE